MINGRIAPSGSAIMIVSKLFDGKLRIDVTFQLDQPGLVVCGPGQVCAPPQAGGRWTRTWIESARSQNLFPPIIASDWEYLFQNADGSSGVLVAEQVLSLPTSPPTPVEQLWFDFRASPASANYGLPLQFFSGVAAPLLYNGAELFMSFGRQVPASGTLGIQITHNGNFSLNQIAAAYTITVTNTQSTPTTGLVSVADSLPVGLTYNSISGSGWSCSLSTGAIVLPVCLRSDTLNPGQSYPPLTLLVNVNPDSPNQLINLATVNGGGFGTGAAADFTWVSFLAIAKIHLGTFFTGAIGAQYIITVSNPNQTVSNGTVTVTESLPAGITPNSLNYLSGPGWSCSGNTCTRADPLPPNGSYPQITALVNVSAAAGTVVTNRVTVSGGGFAGSYADDTFPIGTLATPTLVVAKTHSGSFLQGQKNATYTITVSNAQGAGPTNGTTTVTETLPAGMTLVSMHGTGWTCGGVVCTRSDVLYGSESYPSITVTVNVAANATSPQVNSVQVSGGGSAPAIATDSTVILADVPTAISVTPGNGIGPAQTFSAAFGSPSGFDKLRWAQLLFAVTSDGGGQTYCFVHYDVQGNSFWLYGDGGFFVGPITPGTASNRLQNSLCALNTSGSTAAGSGTNLAINASLVFKQGVTRNIYMRAQNVAGVDTGWVQRGTWTLSAAATGTMSLSPGSGAGSTQTFTLTYPDPAGFAGAAFGWTQFLIAAASDGGGQPFCFVHYDRGGNRLWMYSSDVGFFLGPVVPGTASNALNSSACSVNTASATVNNTGGNLMVNVPITMKSPMSGARKLFQRTLDVLNRDTGWQQTGVWTVP